MGVQVLGRRFSVSPVLGAVRFAHDDNVVDEASQEELDQLFPHTPSMDPGNHRLLHTLAHTLNRLGQKGFDREYPGGKKKLQDLIAEHKAALEKDEKAAEEAQHVPTGMPKGIKQLVDLFHRRKVLTPAQVEYFKKEFNWKPPAPPLVEIEHHGHVNDHGPSGGAPAKGKPSNQEALNQAIWAMHGGRDNQQVYSPLQAGDVEHHLHADTEGNVTLHVDPELTRLADESMGDPTAKTQKAFEDYRRRLADLHRQAVEKGHVHTTVKLRPDYRKKLEELNQVEHEQSALRAPIRRMIHDDLLKMYEENGRPHLAARMRSNDPARSAFTHLHLASVPESEHKKATTMSIAVLGRRFSLAPVLGVQRFAGPKWARQEGQKAPESAEDYLKALGEGLGEAPGAAPKAETYELEPEGKKPAAASGQGPASSGEKHYYQQRAMERGMGPGRMRAVPVEAARPQGSNVYTRVEGSESPKATAAYAKRRLMPDEELAIDEWVKNHVAKTGSRYVNPMAVALEMDAPVHRIAHYLETKHGLQTVPEHGRPPLVPEGHYGARPQEEGAPGATRHVPPADFEEWLLDHYMRQAASDKRFRGMVPGTQPVPGEEEPAGPTDEEHRDRFRRKVADAQKLAEYAKSGVITPAKAREGASKLSLADEEVPIEQISMTLAGWEASDV